MDEQTVTAPVSDVSAGDGQVTTVAPSTSVTTEQGQGEGVADVQTPDTTTPNPFTEKWGSFLKKKGWDETKGHEQLLTSYEELESKIGNYGDVASKAKLYDDLYTKAIDWQAKARMWDEAQQHLDKSTLDNQIQNGEVDLGKLPVPQLTQLWKEGRIGLNDLPPQVQWQVQRQANADDQAERDQTRQIEERSAKEAQVLTEKHPILKDQYHRDLIASAIETGVVRNGRELSPEEIIVEFEQKIQEAERKGEERLKADMEKLKQGNMERTTSAAPTSGSGKASSVFEAFNYAKNKHNL